MVVRAWDARKHFL